MTSLSEAIFVGVAACVESGSSGNVVPRLPIAVHAASAAAARSAALREAFCIRGQGIAKRKPEKQTARRVPRAVEIEAWSVQRGPRLKPPPPPPPPNPPG